MRAWLALCLCVSASFILRLFVSLGVPVWGWDERRYLSAAWAFYSDVTPPVPLRNALYPFLLQPTFYLGDGFHAGVKAMNAGLISLSMIPLYFLAATYLRPNLALAVAVVSVWLGQNTIVCHAMTEALIFPAFCTLLWALVRANRVLAGPARIQWGSFALVGVAMGVLSHATPKHRPAWLAVFGSLLFVGALAPRPGEGLSRAWSSRARRVALAAIALVCGWIVTVAILNGVVHHAVQGIGVDRYDGVMTRIREDFWVGVRAHPVEVRDMILAHATTLGGVFGVAVALSVVGLGRAIARRDVERVALLAPVVFAAGVYVLLAIVIAVSIDAGNERITFARYYYFTYPGLLLGGTVVAADVSVPRAQRLAVILALVLALSAAVFTFGSGVSTASPYSGIIENADFWYFTFPRWYPWIVLAGWGALLVSLFRLRGWLPHVLLAYVAAYSLISTVSMATLNGFGRSTTTACLSMRRQYPLPAARVDLLSDSRHTAEVSAFLPPFTLRPTIVKGPEIRSSDLPEGADYVFVEGALAVDTDRLEPLARVEGCSLWRVTRAP